MRAMAAFCRRRPSAARPASAPFSPPPGQARSDRQEPSRRGAAVRPSACLGAKRPERELPRIVVRVCVVSACRVAWLGRAVWSWGSFSAVRG
jgi:hypothetical protein